MLKEKILQSVTILSLSIFLFLAILNPGNAFTKKLKVMTTSTDLKSITEYIGGDKVGVESIAKGYANLHHVDPIPSFMVKLSNADLFIRIGMDLEQWAQLLIDGARNPQIRFGSPGHVVASVGVDILHDIQAGAMVDRSLGDIHVLGNPHYWLDPLNGKMIARNILDGLKNGVKSKILDMVDNKLEKIDMNVVIQAVEEGDRFAFNILHGACKHIGLVIANLVNIFNPGMVIIGGDIMEKSNTCMTLIKNIIETKTLQRLQKGLKLVGSQLGKESTPMGAASLVIDLTLNTILGAEK